MTEKAIGRAGRAGLLAACLAVTAVVILPAPEGLDPAAWRTAGVVAAMAVLWMTEALPLAVTALLPLVLFPLLGVAPVKDAAAPFANPVIFLFLGGFILALGVQRWRLHERVAFGIVSLTGSRPTRVLLGFMTATALVSMWINNSATTVMMLPMAMAVAALFRERAGGRGQFGLALMLGVAYASSIGGTGTLVGTAPNALMAGFLRDTYGFEVGFARWMMVGVPVVVLGVLGTHAILAGLCLRGSPTEVPGLCEEVRGRREALGPWSRGEVSVTVVFIGTAAAWLAQPWLQSLVPGLSDAVIAMTGAVLLFVVPADWRRGTFLLAGENLRDIPWSVLLLLGGGLSMAEMVDRTGLAAWLGRWAGEFQGLPLILAVVLVTVSILLLTELTSNTATVATFLPVVASVAVGMGENPLLLVVPTVLAASCAFMLPVGTPPNAIVFASGLVPLPRMARLGLAVNLFFILLIPLVVLTLGARVFGWEAGVMPPWAGR